MSTEAANPTPQPLQERDPNVTPAQAPASKSKKADSGKAKPVGKQKTITILTAADVADIHLDGEADENVPIYDTCDDVRKKITEHLKGTSRAAFARDLSSMLPTTKVTIAHLTRFDKMKGPKAGGHSIAFYAAYVFFEKTRIKQGKKKSAKREKVEEAWKSKGGFRREGSHNLHLWCHESERWWIDNLGQIQITAVRPGGRDVTVDL